MRVGTKVVLAVIAGVIAIDATAAFIAYDVGSETVRERALDSLRSSAFTASVGVLDDVDRHRQVARASAEALADAPADATLEDLRARLAPLAHFGALDSEDVLLVRSERADAYIMTASVPARPATAEERARLERVGSGLAAGVTRVDLTPDGLLIERREGAWSIVLEVPIEDAFAPLSEAFYSREGTATIHDAQGRVIYAPGEIDAPAFVGEAIASRGEYLLDTGETLRSNDDEALLAALAPINLRGSYDVEQLRVYIATSVPESVVMEPYRGAALRAAAAGAVLTLVLCAAIGTVAARLLQPLGKVAALAADVGAGGRPHVEPSRRQDEIGVLQNAFAGMVSQLRDRETALARQDEEFDAALASVTARLATLPSESAVAAEASNEARRLTGALYARVELHGAEPATSGDAGAVGEALELPLAAADDRVGTIHLILPPGGLPAKGASDPRLRILARETAMTIAQVRTARSVEQRNAQLLKQEKFAALGMLSAGVAHEINNPLAFVQANEELAMMMIDSMLEPAAAPPNRDDVSALRETLQSNAEGLRRIRTIVASMRQLSKPGDPGSLVDLNEIVRGAVVLSRPKFGEGRRVVEELSAGRLEVAASADGLGQVMLNLLVNAAEASPPDGLVHVRSSQLADGWARIEVEDEGPGISAEAARQLFHPFFSTKPSGTGLGLSISRQICVEHGGRLEVEPSPRGARFVVEIPPASLGATLRPAAAPPSTGALEHARAKSVHATQGGLA